ncbi:1-(5-phosphoribosyl)-5-[(5-phosphoribosylamino)methylideneamino] imidazole-4-carboxamide isomerase [Thermosyntropha lipolytica DSM 11003]|uniref:1-(5-phosphoribosyl)-5-[(5-phosphoribosylamino)methylideneamino] imidazole-4-carboxamide isomerase n=1 Tax=Thermosyntropha lipolytica DSM 11003 TaxID=1123382 RepID=A0A1M5JAA5_9FIRM|nr:1-(5-phosphoribosyl)-5-[(5-phosphoribosylamino)methylideneamino]imidazole-4-carboxamide isomerase [Thermosyntropha lipolytica]SHG36963.1 1-(5-phosphoribosyl)-5-[(5-phosphoribosylamino)methylideneamino] imidazole-4-carboxamide isomerase [Thermosyntropha lipolytica DSM 11003]
MIIYPAIDIKEGKCVRLVQGKAEEKKVYALNPAEVARDFARKGAKYLHIVDLDGAFAGRPQNQRIIREIAEAVAIPFQIGGGLRTEEDIENILSLGADRVIIGTKAVSSPDFVKRLLDRFGAEKIVLGIDARDGMVAVAGWLETATIEAVQLGIRMRDLGVKTAIVTDISRDGMLKGPNLAFIKEMAEKTGLNIIASGGVSSLEDIRAIKALAPLGVKGAVIGKALYEGRISLEAALKEAEDTEES